ncbi:hypothetical protein [Streptomyces sp. NPDC060002]|uniref:hypothetical protein n=1 Tax=Streptomyces sp. NPDC060002 TaxID=3347033 RepID=UPI00367CFD86
MADDDVLRDTDLLADVRSHPSVALMVAGANGQARRIAPGLFGADTTDAQRSEARLTLLGAITRWTQHGADAVQQQTAGPFSLGVDARLSSGCRLWPSEVQQLREIVSGPQPRRAFVVDRVPVQRTDREHHPGCDFFFSRGNGIDCSCGLS